MKTKTNKDGLLTIMLFIIIILLSTILIILHTNSQIKYEKEYYKSAMLSFCEISTIQNELLEQTLDKSLLQYLPEMKECEYFILSSNKK